jgi:catechol 2,3-dioxygenase-like lactoylglutathione lyase family enzyme
MLNSRQIVAFVPTKRVNEARAFYKEVLGLRFVSEDSFALMFDADGTMLRVSIVPDFKPHPFTILGWQVPNIQEAVSDLRAKGVTFEHFGFAEQDVQGIWSAPGGAKVAWFKDPDGNVLSLTQLA